MVGWGGARELPTRGSCSCANEIDDLCNDAMSSSSMSSDESLSVYICLFLDFFSWCYIIHSVEYIVSDKQCTTTVLPESRGRMRRECRPGCTYGAL